MPTAKRLFHVGDILGAHGLKGALTVYSHTRPAEAIADYHCWYLGQSRDNVTTHSVRRCWRHKKAMLAELEAVSDRDVAESMKGLSIFVDADEVALSDDEYLWEDLVGCTVVTDTGRMLGKVTALQEYGAQDILTVTAGEGFDEPGEWMLPFTEAVILSVDLDGRRIDVCLPEGMDACFTPGS